MRFEPGSNIGEWKLVAPVDMRLSAPLWIGDNGSVVVYVRRYRVHNQKVVKRLEQLAKWAAAFEHSCIVPTREVVEVVGGAAVVSTYEEGQPLSSVLQRARLARKPVPPPVAVAIAVHLLDALHAMGGRLAPAWAHGGLRPETVLLTRGGSARIMEVGISAEMATHDPYAREKSWAPYATPEEVRGEALKESTDVFTVASLLWEMLVGKPLFDGRDANKIQAQILAGEVKPPHAAAKGDVPRALSMIVEQALEIEQEDRFQTTTELANALRSAAPEVGEAVDVSRYLEGVQRVALDGRRRSLSQALGRAAPTSMPPPGLRSKGSAVNIPKFAPPPNIPSFALTPKPVVAKPATAKAKPGAARPTKDSVVDDTEQRVSAPLELLTPKPADAAELPPVQTTDAQREDEARSGDEASHEDNARAADDAPSEEVKADAENDVPSEDANAAGPPGDAKDAGDVANDQESPATHAIDDGNASDEIAPPEPSLSMDIPVDESLAGAPPSSDDIPIDESLAGESEPPPSLSVDIRMDESLPGRGGPTDTDEDDAPVEAAAPAAETPTAQSTPPPAPEPQEPEPQEPEPPEPEPTAPPAQRKPGPAPTAPPAQRKPEPAPTAAVAARPEPPIDPFADLNLDDDNLELRPPRRWPWFIGGIAVGAAGVLGIVYQAPHLLPALPGARTATPAPTKTVPPPPPPAPAPVPEPTTEPTASASATSAAVSRPTPRSPAPVRPIRRPRPAPPADDGYPDPPPPPPE